MAHIDNTKQFEDGLVENSMEMMNMKNNEICLTSDKDYSSAKSFLLQTSPSTGLNLYDHLTKVLAKVLDERPNNAVDIFESYCKKARHAEENAVVSREEEVKLAEIQQKLFSKGEGEDGEIEDDVESPILNISEICFFFEQASIGLNREEMVRIGLALKTLTDLYPLEHARFWGKIIGTKQNYLVAEVEYREGEEEEEEEEGFDEAAEEQDKAEEGSDDEENEAIPKVVYKAPPVAPKEEQRTGANKKTYFVCSEPGTEWTKLPQVTPQQIYVARRIRKFFTGHLNTPIISYPPFPGNEANYLRAQIARISAGTHISPVGFYQFDEDEDDDDEGAIRDNFIINTEFEQITPRELVDPSLGNWVHHVLHILPQGRCTWWNPKQTDEEEEEEEEDEDNNRPASPKPEVGPPLLSPLSEDAHVNGMPSWTLHLSSQLMPQYAVAVVHSCLWPGAHAFAHGRTFENIYIGWGHKYSADNYGPPPPPPVQEELPTGPELAEADDPTPEQLAELNAALDVADDPDDGSDAGVYDDDDDDD